MKILFAGSPNSSAEILQNLSNADCEVVGVISQPDKRTKRRGELEPTEVSAMAKELEIPLYKPNKLDEQFKELILEVECDYLVVSAYGKILPDWLLNHPKIAPINIHFSLLPKYRGASPIQSVLLNGDALSGISIMKMTSGLDEGPVYTINELKISVSANKIDLEKGLTLLCKKVLMDSLISISKNEIMPTNQKHENASYCNKITKESGRVNFLKEDSLSIMRKFKAFSEWPGLFFEHNNTLIKIRGMSQATDIMIKNNLRNFDFVDGAMLVKTIDSTIVITHLQFPSKKVITAVDAANSYADFFTA